jgi:hypothetical protein
LTRHKQLVAQFLEANYDNVSEPNRTQQNLWMQTSTYAIVLTYETCHV